ncbi:DUF3291 domain-containing protein [Silvibacterium dinghuense]|uniref:DUF3291 domain-containing protein n=1 Tax=Silvibacterium dinghuense TaxID=1560006 RepID=A0A4Q1SH73_9BACT|nr:DUF3291 domain-containing protein [Silvibacterium dinghuense]RXS96886.1 DUF3291 domain-containing protein [Silvibacterium dinghuense]GGG94432.1 hypothetical protein GCM10011586_06670 [Silvibacterium dinghuense]
MVLISVTRLRIRSPRFLPSFAVYTLRSLLQARKAGGFVAGALLPDRERTFWTMTLWQSEEAMRTFMSSGAHRQAMPKLMHWCDEAAVVRWQQAEAALPGWGEADRRLRAEGRASKVLHPSADHEDLSYRAPSARGVVRIRPA